MGYLLIVHAQDANDIVTPIVTGLRRLDLDCLTYKEKLKIAPLGSIVIHLLEDMVETASVVLAFASPALLSDYKALSITDYAAAQGNLIFCKLPGASTGDLPPSFYRASCGLELSAQPEAQLTQIMSVLDAQLNPHF
ncbi:MAG TPA: hypothetical protein VF837_03605 [Patescibacteria group bacterium]